MYMGLWLRALFVGLIRGLYFGGGFCLRDVWGCGWGGGGYMEGWGVIYVHDKVLIIHSVYSI